MVGRRTIIRLANCPMVGRRTKIRLTNCPMVGRRTKIRLANCPMVGRRTNICLANCPMVGRRTNICLANCPMVGRRTNCHIIYRESSVNPSPRRPSSRSGGSQTARGSVFRREVAGRADPVHRDLPFYRDASSYGCSACKS